ncbi:ABC transporter ATP-binding protein [Lewinella sp. IMCC34183]|uniref:ABC transporter ATP-binding protein n=1 Tax=Lewinella sp. IMCC34183 TaxID=2248762 RepID=UPI000E222545|nr:ABC transporter ATP-binding protein [Lewinella sp. IMCC34183]
MIEVSGLSKRYRLGSSKRDDTLVGAAKGLLTYPLRNYRELRQRKKFADKGEEDDTVLWALREVDFTVETGEVLGIIGHNGAGKSTLLKILSRITEPTEGRVVLRGRVSSLLEVGTGFHSDLSGRDNVFMNGTILGMSRREVRQKFDEIVAFSGVGSHIDTPVKFYSSGMKVRLAFAVAAHLDPEILIIDEVLAVGDLAFQEKCLAKMDNVSRSGRTVLFVSHNMGAVEGLCQRCLLMERGRKVFDGAVPEAIARYRDSTLSRASAVDLADRTDRYGDGAIRFQRVSFNGGRPVVVGEPLRVEVEFLCTEAIDSWQFTLRFCRNYREAVIMIDSKSQGVALSAQAGLNKLTIDLPSCTLMPNRYLVEMWANSSNATVDGLFDAASVTVQEGDPYGTGTMVYAPHNGLAIAPRGQWRIAKDAAPVSGT